MVETVAPWRVRWTNFRGYEKSPVLEFPAMTLLIGRNNAGKTSAYAPLLLLRQTLEARNPATALLFRGDLVDFGTYNDVVTDHDASREMTFRLDFGEPSIGFLLRNRDLDFPQPRVLEVTFRSSAEHTATVRRSVVLDASEKQIVSRTLQSGGEYKVVSPLLPANRDVGRPIKEVTALRKALQSEPPEGFFFSGVAGIALPSSWRRDRDRWEKAQGWYRAAGDIYDVYSVINHHVRQTLRSVSYIGPLRSSPQRSYLRSAEPPIDVGRDGQWASEVLFQASLHEGAGVLDRANAWLERLGYGRLAFESSGEYFQVFVQKPGSDLAVNLADCGVGLSQLLPLLVQGCVMEEGDTLVAQQPEIHLNPAQQDVMTDFLIELCATGRRVIVETHSEHVLGRLRRRIAEGESIGSEDVALYFSENRGNRSAVRRISIGELGDLNADEWPEGFFSEQLNNSLKMAMAQSRRRAARALEHAEDSDAEHA